MSTLPLKIRSMNHSDIHGAMKLKNAEGWNQTEKDWKIFITNRTNINLVAEYKNRIIGTVTAANYADNVAWIGMMIINRKFRGRGISKLLLDTVIKKLEQNNCKSVKLDATSAGLPVYKKLGFIAEYEIYRMTSDSIADFPLESSLSSTQMTEQTLQKIIRFDQMAFGVNRKILLESMAKNFPHKIWLKKTNDQVLGFALGRDGTRFHQVGPVSAETPDTAKALVQYALKSLVGQSVVVDILADKPELYHWLTSVGFSGQRHFMRMYLKTNPFPGDTKKQFLICGPEFG